MPDRPATRIIAVANQKGGVGKTTTSINVAAAMAEAGRKVLIVDLDPQGNASTGLGIEAEARKISTYDLLFGDVTVQDACLSTSVDGLTIVPATSDLSSGDIDIHASERRTLLLRDALRAPDVQALGLDYVIIDCPPSLSLLTLNALIAANAILVPLQSEFFALEGLSQLLMTVREVRKEANRDLRIEGIVMTMFDGRNRLAQQVLKDARDTLGDLVFDTVIPRNVRISEAPSYAQPVTVYDPTSKGSAAYRMLTLEILNRTGAEAAP